MRIHCESTRDWHAAPASGGGRRRVSCSKRHADSCQASSKKQNFSCVLARQVEGRTRPHPAGVRRQRHGRRTLHDPLKEFCFKRQVIERLPSAWRLRNFHQNQAKARYHKMATSAIAACRGSPVRNCLCFRWLAFAQGASARQLDEASHRAAQ